MMQNRSRTKIRNVCPGCFDLYASRKGLFIHMDECDVLKTPQNIMSLDAQLADYDAIFQIFQTMNNMVCNR